MSSRGEESDINLPSRQTKSCLSDATAVTKSKSRKSRRRSTSRKNAATKIQSTWRGHRVRKKYKSGHYSRSGATKYSSRGEESEISLPSRSANTHWQTKMCLADTAAVTKSKSRKSRTGTKSRVTRFGATNSSQTTSSFKSLAPSGTRAGTRSGRKSRRRSMSEFKSYVSGGSRRMNSTKPGEHTKSWAPASPVTRTGQFERSQFTEKEEEKKCCCPCWVIILLILLSLIPLNLLGGAVICWFKPNVQICSGSSTKSYRPPRPSRIVPSGPSKSDLAAKRRKEERERKEQERRRKEEEKRYRAKQNADRLRRAERRPSSSGKFTEAKDPFVKKVAGGFGS